MKALILILVFLTPGAAFADITVASWNAKRLGRDSLKVEYAARLIGTVDLLAIQEVNTSASGAKALASLARELERVTGDRYCQALSEVPTDARERYAVLYREKSVSYVTTSGQEISSCPSQTITLRLGERGAQKIIREPAVGVFKDRKNDAKFTLAIIHLVPTAKRPEGEVPHLFDTVEHMPGKYPKVVLGDFNLSSGHRVFADAKANGYRNVLGAGERTSLKMKSRSLNEAYDNIFVKGASHGAGRVHNPYEAFPELSVKEIYGGISDHAPVSVRIFFSK